MERKLTLLPKQRPNYGDAHDRLLTARDGERQKNIDRFGHVVPTGWHRELAEDNELLVHDKFVNAAGFTVRQTEGELLVFDNIGIFVGQGTDWAAVDEAVQNYQHSVRDKVRDSLVSLLTQAGFSKSAVFVAMNFTGKCLRDAISFDPAYSKLSNDYQSAVWADSQTKAEREAVNRWEALDRLLCLMP
jgi:hypothetical protein